MLPKVFISLRMKSMDGTACFLRLRSPLRSDHGFPAFWPYSVPAISRRVGGRPESVLVNARSDLEFATVRRVAAQSEDVLEVQGANTDEEVAYLVLGGAHARQMGHRSQTVLPMDAVHDHQRLVPRAAAGAVGHRAAVT